MVVFLEVGIGLYVIFFENSFVLIFEYENIEGYIIFNLVIKEGLLKFFIIVFKLRFLFWLIMNVVLFISEMSWRFEK